MSTAAHMPPVSALAQTNRQLVNQQLARGYNNPLILLDSETIREKARRFIAAMPRVTPHFAVKSNPDTRVLKILRDEGVNFEIASKAELDALLDLEVPTDEIFYSNPVKSRAYLTHAVEQGVQWYVVDSVEELQKVISAKPNAKLYLRIYTSNEGSEFPLSSKFGAHRAETEAVIQRALKLDADLAGVTFHVGSQCTNLDNWRRGIRAARKVFDQMIKAGLDPRMLDLGGGYPVDLSTPVPSIEAIGQLINRELEAFPNTIKIIAEPGRYLVADAGYFVCQVIGTTTRQGKRWLFLDAGIYSGLAELKDGLDFAIDTDRKGPLVPWTIAGPTCDAVDACTDIQLMPMDMAEGDFVYIKHAGAYSNACASRFNGFPLPEVIVV